MTILGEIFGFKKIEVNERRQVVPMEVLIDQAAQYMPIDFLSFLRPQIDTTRHPALIAEVKRASPSRGEFGMHIDPAALARIYRENGAKAVSVLTDERYFKGSLEYLVSIRNSEPDLPILRKDFICDPYQVYEARAAGADAVLLIVAGLEFSLLKELYNLVNEMGMTALIEVHNEFELEKAFQLNPGLIGVNNRDLRDFSVDLGTSVRLRSLIPNSILVVAESGIHTRRDVALLAQAGMDAILVGESLVTSVDIGEKVKELSGINYSADGDEGAKSPSSTLVSSKPVSHG